MDRLPTPIFLGFPCGSDDKESTHNAGDVDSIPGLGRSHGEGKGYALQYSGQENSMDCRSPGKGIGYSLQYSVQVNFMDCIVHGVAKSERRDRLSTPAFVDFPCGSAGKGSACNVGDLGSIPGLGRSPGEGKGYQLQYSCLENSMDFIVHVVTQIGRRDRLPTPVFSGFLCGSAGKESACNAGNLGSIPGLGRSPGEGNGYPLQYSALEKCTVLYTHGIVHGVTKSWTQLSDIHCHFYSMLQNCDCVQFLFKGQERPME